MRIRAETRVTGRNQFSSERLATQMLGKPFSAEVVIQIPSLGPPVYDKFYRTIMFIIMIVR